jgi:hypothetical protein
VGDRGKRPPTLTDRSIQGTHPRSLMANRAIWNVRKRHEWLASPLKAKRVKRAQRLRNGQQDALDRKAGTTRPTES